MFADIKRSLTNDIKRSATSAVELEKKGLYIIDVDYLV